MPVVALVHRAGRLSLSLQESAGCADPSRRGCRRPGQDLPRGSTAYSANNVRRISRYTRSNRVYYVPFDKLSEQFKRIHAEGGKISSITPVN